jgi:hypothetical protein
MRPRRFRYRIPGVVPSAAAIAVIAVGGPTYELVHGNSPLVTRPAPPAKVIVVNNAVVHPHVVEVADAAIVALPTAHSNRLVLSGPQEVKRGDFLTTKPGENAAEGFLLKALSVGEAAGDTIVVTQPASLFEAEPVGSLIADTSDFLAPGASLIPQAEPTAAGALATAAWRTAADDDPGLEWSLFHVLVKGGCEHKGQLPRLELKPSFEPFFDLQWDDRNRFHPRVEAAAVRLDASLLTTLSGVFSERVHCELEPKRPLQLFYFPVLTPALIHVPIRLSATGTLEADAKITSEVKEREFQVRTKGFARVEWDGHRLQPSAGVRIRSSGGLPRPEPGAEASLGVNPRIELEAGWRLKWLGRVAAVATLTIGSGVDLKYAPTVRPPVKACVPLTLKGGFRIHFLRLKPWKKTTGRYKVAEKCFPREPPKAK